MNSKSNPDVHAVRELAYHLSQADGGRHASEHYWLEAERQLSAAQPPVKAATTKAVDDSIRQSFPASDPPASRRADVPPVNAEAKWDAAEKAKKKTSRAASTSRIRSDSKRPTH